MKKTIKKTILIRATPKKIWDVLFTDRTYRIWASEFAKDAYAETDWKAGSKAKFIDPSSNSGMIGRIAEVKPNEFLKIEYDGFIEKGKEDYESEGAREMKGGIESYTLSEKSNGVELAISCDMAEQWFDQINEAWDRALLKIKELAEK
jgi:hypothetical protein